MHWTLPSLSQASNTDHGCWHHQPVFTPAATNRQLFHNNSNQMYIHTLHWFSSDAQTSQIKYIYFSDMCDMCVVSLKTHNLEQLQPSPLSPLQCRYTSACISQQPWVKWYQKAVSSRCTIVLKISSPELRISANAITAAKRGISLEAQCLCCSCRVDVVCF